MPCNYWGEAKIKFPLPSYPKEDAFEDSTKYEAAVDGFGMDCQQVLAECSTWVDHKTITDLMCKSEATRARVVDNKKSQGRGGEAMLGDGGAPQEVGAGRYCGVNSCRVVNLGS